MAYVKEVEGTLNCCSLTPLPDDPKDFPCLSSKALRKFVHSSVFGAVFGFRRVRSQSWFSELLENVSAFG